MKLINALFSATLRTIYEKYNSSEKLIVVYTYTVFNKTCVVICWNHILKAEEAPVISANRHFLRNGKGFSRRFHMRQFVPKQTQSYKQVYFHILLTSRVLGINWVKQHYSRYDGACLSIQRYQCPLNTATLLSCHYNNRHYRTHKKEEWKENSESVVIDPLEQWTNNFNHWTLYTRGCTTKWTNTEFCYHFGNFPNMNLNTNYNIESLFVVRYN